MEKRIADLKGQLLNLGYHQMQIDNILRDSVGTTDTTSLSKEAALQLADELTEYVSFAVKCRTKRLC